MHSGCYMLKAAHLAEKGHHENLLSSEALLLSCSEKGGKELRCCTALHETLQPHTPRIILQ